MEMRQAQTPHYFHYLGMTLRIGLSFRQKAKNLATISMILLGLLTTYLLVQVYFFPNVSYAALAGSAKLAGVLYPGKMQSQVVVAELNNDYLEYLEEPWPPSYGAYARMLDDIALLRPKSIFLDIALRYPREDRSVTQLVQTICGMKARGIQVYLAGLEDSSGRLRFISELEVKAGTCFTPVGIRYDPDPASKLTVTYPLLGNAAAPASASPEALAARSTIASAAYAIARNEPQSPLALQRPENMALVWNVQNHTPSPWGLWDYCRYVFQPWQELIPAGIRQAWQGEAAYAPLCPPHRHVPLQLISAPDSAEAEAWLEQMVRGKHVMVGASVAGVNDTATSPVHGNVGGVYMHAMALDNLLTYGADFKRRESLFQSNLALFLSFTLIIGVLNFFIHGKLKSLVDAWLPDPPLSVSKEALATADWHASWKGRLVGQLKMLLAFCINGVAQIVISLLLSLIGFYFLQKISTHSLQDFAQVVAVSLTLQWTGITGKVVRSVMHIIEPTTH